MTQPRARRAFTLMELILALGMTAVLAFSLFASLRIGFRARDAAAAAVERVRGIQITMDLLGHDLKGCMVLPDDPDQGTLVQDFQGLAAGSGSATGSNLNGSVVFYALTPDESTGVSTATPPASAVASEDSPLQAAGVRKIEWGLQSNGNSNDLVRLEWTNLLSEFDETDPDKTEVILSGVDSFYFEYSADGENWEDSWDSTAEGNVLPLAVHAVLVMKNGDGTTFERTYLLPLATPPSSTG